MSTIKKIKTDNNKIFQDIIDFEILTSLFNYLLISKKNKNNYNNNNNNKNNNNRDTSNQYKINKFYLNRNEILNYILVSKKWHNFISLTISNNIINNKLFEHWLKINYNSNKSFIENYNNQNQYNKNNLFLKTKDYKLNKISFNKEFSIIKIKESIINDYFKFNLFLNNISIDDFKEIKMKFENNQLVYNRIVVNDNTLFEIHQYVSNENSEIISNLFKILELNYDFYLSHGYRPVFEEANDNDTDKGNKKCTEIYLNNLSIDGFNRDVLEDEETLKIFKIFKGKNLIYDGSDDHDEFDEFPTKINYSALFDPDNSGQQVESIIVKNEPDHEGYVKASNLIKVNQFENLHSITIPIHPFEILSDISEEIGFFIFNRSNTHSNNMESELNLNEMINSLITCKSLRNLNMSSVDPIYPINYKNYNGNDEILVNKINENIESLSNSFKPLFSESNTSIERIELDCCGLLNINTFSNLLNNKSIKYLFLNNCDFIVHPKTIDNDDNGNELHKEPISINQYLFENIFSSSLTSIRHYKIKFDNSKQLKLIFNIISNNIFKLQLYSLIFEFNENELICQFVIEFRNLINNISTQQQKLQQQQKSNNINLKEIKIKIKIDDKYIQELSNINDPYFATVIKKIL
ncbi:hypothetical protein ACTFIZ_001981 [Dictyostelium cf. discoideum]